MLGLLMRELNLTGEEATRLLASLPKSVLSLHVKHGLTKEFCDVAKLFMGDGGADARHDERFKFLTNKLKAKYTVDQLSELSKIDKSIIDAVYNNSHMSARILDHLASFVDLTLQYVSIGDYYLDKLNDVKPPIIYGYMESDYQDMRFFSPLPHGIFVGEDVELTPFQIGKSRVEPVGELTALRSETSMINDGDVVYAMSIGVDLNLYRWCTQLKDTGEGDRVIMTLNSTAITATSILNSISHKIKPECHIQLQMEFSEESVRVDDMRFVVLVKLNETKRVHVTFKGLINEVSSVIDFSKVKFNTIGHPAVTIVD